jgi:acetoin utilization deacetylase AcuC-like enzyme
MSKYARLRERLTGDTSLDLRVPDAATDRELLRVHAPAYLRAVIDGSLPREAVRRIGFPWSPELVERSRRSVGGTIGAARAALEEGRGANLAGGTHHAFADRGEGFCVFNDVAVAVRTLQQEGRVRRIAIVDLDVHQGNGTAAIFARDPSVLTTSVHGASNYPFRKESSDLDIPLPDGTTDDGYLEAVDAVLGVAAAHAPDLLFYVAGADAYEGDKLGRLAVTAAGLAERDRRVFAAAESAGTPVAVVMAGGYAPDIERIVEIHAHTVREAARGCRPGHR